MDTEHRDISPPPPPLEEGYWRALLNEGEYAQPVRRSKSSRQLYTNQEPTLAMNTRLPSKHAADTSTIEADWEAIEQVSEADKTVSLTVIGYNRGGLLVEWRHIRGFVPASQLVTIQDDNNMGSRQQELEGYVGSELELRVIELNPEMNRLVFSERAAQVQPGTRDDILSSVQAGEIVEGIATNITDFGVFIDLGGIEGLVHISELSWGRVAHPGDILQQGENVRAYVLETNKEEGRIALSVKRLQVDPWLSVRERYEVGEVIDCHVTNVVEFGAFACIEDGLEGLIHISELAEGHFLHPRNVVQEGQQITARILSIEPEKRRLGLSLRQLHTPDDHIT